MTEMAPTPERLPVAKLDRRPDAALRGHLGKQQHWPIGCGSRSMILPNLLLINPNLQDNPPAAEARNRFPMGACHAR